MGTWGTGPLDNDAAADWYAELDNTAPDQRAKLIRQALVAAANVDASDYLNSDLASEAVAAAVVIASLGPAGPPLDSTDALVFLQDNDITTLPADLARLSLKVLDRVDGANSELPEPWGDDYAQVLQYRQPIRAARERAAANEQVEQGRPVRAGAAKPSKARTRVRFTSGSVLLVPARTHRALAVMTAREPFIAFYGCDRDPEQAEMPALCAGRVASQPTARFRKHSTSRFASAQA
jgi:hypothetical protein